PEAAEPEPAEPTEEAAAEPAAVEPAQTAEQPAEGPSEATAAPAPEPSPAPAAAGQAPPAAASHMSVETTTIYEIVKNPQAKAALEKEFPMLNTFYGQIGDLTLRQVQKMGRKMGSDTVTSPGNFEAALKEMQALFD